MCEKMIANPNIKILINTDFKEISDKLSYKYLIYTGSIDEYFDYCYGELLYRSIHFEFETYDMESFQPTASSRYPIHIIVLILCQSTQENNIFFFQGFLPIFLRKLFPVFCRVRIIFFFNLQDIRRITILPVLQNLKR